MVSFLKQFNLNNKVNVVIFNINCHKSVLDSVVKRVKQLEELITDNNASNLVKQVAILTTSIASSALATTTSISNQLDASTNSGKIISIETLLDAIVILYDECSNSSLRREKTVSDFLELCEYINFYLISSGDSYTMNSW